MNRYKIPCTEEQTKKALELGAPILLLPEEFYTEEEHFRMEIEGNNAYVILPTAEEMIGWLEDQGMFIDVSCDNSEYVWSVWTTIGSSNISFGDEFDSESFVPRSFVEDNDGVIISSRKEAILSAIGAALEYLTNKTMEE